MLSDRRARVHPHPDRYTMARQNLADNRNDRIGLAQPLGHDDLDTTARSARRSGHEPADAAERVTF